MGPPCPCFSKEYREQHIHPRFGRFYINTKGYPRMCGGKGNGWRQKYLHILVWEEIAGRKVPDGWHVHHQDGDKWHCCGWNLVAVPAELNPKPEQLRDPYTGQYMTREQWVRRYRELPEYARTAADRLAEVPF